MQKRPAAQDFEVETTCIGWYKWHLLEENGELHKLSIYHRNLDHLRSFHLQRARCAAAAAAAGGGEGGGGGGGGQDVDGRPGGGARGDREPQIQPR